MFAHIIGESLPSLLEACNLANYADFKCVFCEIKFCTNGLISTCILHMSLVGLDLTASQ